VSSRALRGGFRLYEAPQASGLVFMNLMDYFQVSSRLSRGLPRTFNVTLYLAILCGIVSFKLCAVCRCHAPFPSHLGLFLDTRLQPSYAFSSHFSSNFLHPEPDLGNIVDKLSIGPWRHFDSNPRGDLGQDIVMISFKVVFYVCIFYLSDDLDCILSSSILIIWTAVRVPFVFLCQVINIYIWTINF